MIDFINNKRVTKWPDRGTAHQMFIVTLSDLSGRDSQISPDNIIPAPAAGHSAEAPSGMPTLFTSLNINMIIASNRVNVCIICTLILNAKSKSFPSEKLSGDLGNILSHWG